MLRFVFGAVNRFKSYSLEFKERSEGLFCYVRTWDGVRMKRVCVLVEAPDVRLPHSELLCLSRVKSSVSGSPYPVALVGGSSSVVNCLNAVRDDGMTFVPYRAFTHSVFLKCIQQAHQDVFGMLDIVTIIDYLMARLRTASYEEWIDGHVTLKRCVRAGQVSFEDLRGVIEDIRSLWQPIQQFVRYTGPAHLKERRDAVSNLVDVLVTFREWRGYCLDEYIFH